MFSERKSCDLHTHSCFSDGTYTPRELLEAADEIGLSAIALCDHNTVAGLDAFVEAGKDFSAEAVPGIELSTEWRGKELHIIGLYVKREHYGKIGELVADMRKEKEKSYRACIASLKAAGYDLDYDELSSRTEGGINRAHIAAELVKLGYVGSAKEAFASLLSKSGGYYNAPKYISAIEAIKFLKSIGTAVVWAHPYLSLSADEVREFLPLAKDAGLDAMEVLYSKYSEETTLTARATAAEFGILESGGSDFHGPIKPDVALGVGRGNLFIPYELLTEIKKRKK